MKKVVFNEISKVGFLNYMESKIANSKGDKVCHLCWTPIEHECTGCNVTAAQMESDPFLNSVSERELSYV